MNRCNASASTSRTRSMKWEIGDALVKNLIAQTIDRIEKTAWQLDQYGSEKAAGYLYGWLPSIVTLLRQLSKGFEVPWISNPVERLIGEVSNRCKNQWMRWIAGRLEGLLQFRLVKYTDPSHYQLFLDELLQRSIKTSLRCDFSNESTRKKL